MNRLQLGIWGIVAALGIVLLVLVFYPTSGPKNPIPSISEQNPFPSAGSIAASTTPPTGRSIGDILKSSDTIQLGPDDYIIAETASRYQSQEYQITYHAPDGVFTVSLEAEPLRQTREHAERRFLALLGITQNQACMLRVNVTTLWSVNPTYAGRNLGFSFCPGAAVLP